MSEAYWIDSSAAGLDELLRRSGARRDWIEEAHWLGETPENPPEGAAAGFYWPAASAHVLLNLLGQAIVSGERSLIMIGQPAAACALLAGPKAVGRYNLSPRARLTARFTHANAAFTGWLETIAARLERAERDPGEVAWLAVDRPPVAVPPALPNARWLESAEPLLDRLAGLIQRMEADGSPAGLLISLPAGQPWLATLVERM